MRILVTGGDGQLASCLKRCILNSNNEWHFFNKNDLDITNVDNVYDIFEKYEPSVVVNCAAYTNVDNTPKDLINAKKLNEEGPLNLVMCAKQYDAKVIHISTDYVFNGTKNTPYETNEAVNAINKYGETKLAGEKAILKNNNAIVIRTSWLYSEFGKNFFKTMFFRILNGDKTLVVDDQIGTPTYAMDLAEFIKNIIESETINTMGKQVFHYSNDGCCSWYDFAKTIEFFLKKQWTNILFNEDVIYPVSTEEYVKKIDKLIEPRPQYSVMSKKSLDNIPFSYRRHWVTALSDCMSRFLLDELYKSPEKY